MPKKIRRRGSKKTCDLNTSVTTSAGQDDFENPSHQALQPRPILDALLVSLNFASIKNILDFVFVTFQAEMGKSVFSDNKIHINESITIYWKRLFGRINAFK